MHKLPPHRRNDGIARELEFLLRLAVAICASCEIPFCI